MYPSKSYLYNHRLTHQGQEVIAGRGGGKNRKEIREIWWCVCLCVFVRLCSCTSAATYTCWLLRFGGFWNERKTTYTQHVELKSSVDIKLSKMNISLKTRSTRNLKTYKTEAENNLVVKSCSEVMECLNLHEIAGKFWKPSELLA